MHGPCGNEENTPQLKQCEFNEYHMGNTAPYMTESLRVKKKKKKKKIKEIKKKKCGHGQKIDFAHTLSV